MHSRSVRGSVAAYPESLVSSQPFQEYGQIRDVLEVFGVVLACCRSGQKIVERSRDQCLLQHGRPDSTCTSRHTDIDSRACRQRGSYTLVEATVSCGIVHLAQLAGEHAYAADALGDGILGTTQGVRNSIGTHL